jgi:hypothetical protein
VDEDHRERHVAVLRPDELVRVLRVLQVVELEDGVGRVVVVGHRQTLRASGCGAANSTSSWRLLLAGVLETGQIFSSPLLVNDGWRRQGPAREGISRHRLFPGLPTHLGGRDA